MKAPAMTVSLILLFLFSNAQAIYLSPNFHALRVLDSLSIPYLPISYRVMGRGYSEEFKNEFISMFGETFQFIPQYTESDVSFKDAFGGKEAVDESERWLLDVLSNLEVFVLGSFRVPLTHESDEAIWIIETYGKISNSYETIVFAETKENKVYVINEDIDRAFANGWLPSFR